MLWMGTAALGRFDEILNPKPNLSAFPNALQVIESRMNWAHTQDGPRIYMTGLMTNQSPVSWKDIEFECRYYDGNGVMVDAAHPRGYFTILSNDNTAFRVSVTPTSSTNSYQSYRLSVTTARNARSHL
jgi:hypothetical protein